MKFLNYENVVCISPHPDDIEYSMYGLIAKYVDTNFKIIVLTNGNDDEKGEERMQEVTNFWFSSKLKNYELIYLNYNNIVDVNIMKLTSDLEGIITPNVKCIFTPPTGDSHPEHVKSNLIVNSICRNKLISIIEYKTPSILNSWNSNFFIDINNTINTKIELLSVFKTQKHLNYFNPKLIRAFHTSFFYSKRNNSFCEQYNIRILYE